MLERPSKSPHKILHVSNFTLLLFIAGLLQRQAFCPNAFEICVVPGLEFDGPGVQVCDVVDAVIKKLTIMGNEQQCAGVMANPVSQPDDCIEIQVVGRLAKPSRWQLDLALMP